MENFAERIQNLLINPEKADLDAVRKELAQIANEIKSHLLAHTPANIGLNLLYRQTYILAKWYSSNPAFIVDFFCRILFVTISQYIKHKSVGKEPPPELLEEILVVTEKFKEALNWTSAIFPHSRGAINQIIQAIEQITKNLDVPKEERRLLNRIRRSLEPIRRMSAEEVPLSISMSDILIAFFPFSWSKSDITSFIDALNHLFLQVDALSSFYQQILARPVFQDIERPTVDNLDVWKHYWSNLITFANDVVQEWGWPSLPPMDIVIFTGTLIENIASSYAYTYKTTGRPPIFVINLPVAKRGSSPADLHLVTHEATPGHIFNLTLLERGLKKLAQESELEEVESFEGKFPFLSYGVASLYYEGWATFAQWIFGLRRGTPRYLYQWIVELKLYLDRVAFTVGVKKPDMVHQSRLTDPLQLVSYFIGFLWWRTLYDKLGRDDDELLRYVEFGKLPTIDQITAADLTQTLSKLSKEIENIEKTGRMQL